MVTKLNWTKHKEKEVLDFIKREFENLGVYSGEQVYQDDFLCGQGALEFFGELADLLEPIIEHSD